MNDRCLKWGSRGGALLVSCEGVFAERQWLELEREKTMYVLRYPSNNRGGHIVFCCVRDPDGCSKQSHLPGTSIIFCARSFCFGQIPLAVISEHCR